MVDFNNPENTLLFCCLTRPQILVHNLFYAITITPISVKLSGDYQIR